MRHLNWYLVHWLKAIKSLCKNMYSICSLVPNCSHNFRINDSTQIPKRSINLLFVFDHWYLTRYLSETSNLNTTFRECVDWRFLLRCSSSVHAEHHLADFQAQTFCLNTDFISWQPWTYKYSAGLNIYRLYMGMKGKYEGGNKEDLDLDLLVWRLLQDLQINVG